MNMCVVLMYVAWVFVSVHPNIFLGSGCVARATSELRVVKEISPEIIPWHKSWGGSL